MNKEPLTSVADKLAAIVTRLREAYLQYGYHTFAYWLEFDGAGLLAGELSDLVEDLFPDEWVAAWAPYSNDRTVLSRDPRPQ